MHLFESFQHSLILSEREQGPFIEELSDKCAVGYKIEKTSAKIYLMCSVQLVSGLLQRL